MFEYKMSKAMADAFLQARKGEEKKMKPQDYLIKCVNTQFCLRLPVTKVFVDND